MNDRDPTLLLMHGAGGNAGVWEPVVRELEGFDVITLSLPGRGEAGGDAKETAADAAAWVDAQSNGLASFFVLGHSYGGAVAIELALRCKRVAGLVLVSSGARLRVHPSILLRAEQAVRSGTRMSSAFAFTPHASAEIIATYERAMQKTPPAATARDWGACDRFDRMADVSTIRVPTLVVAGAEDSLTPIKYQRYLAEHIPGAALAIVDKAGHMLPWERPRQLGEELRAFASAARVSCAP